MITDDLLKKLNRCQGRELAQLRQENQQLRQQLERLRLEVAHGAPDLRRELAIVARSCVDRLRLQWHRGCGHAVIPDGYTGVIRDLVLWAQQAPPRTMTAQQYAAHYFGVDA